MIDRILLTVLAAAIFLGVGGYTLRGVDEQSFRLAEVARDSCYARYAIHLTATDVPDEIRRHCTRPLRDYENGWPWRYVFAAAIGATAAFLVAGGIVLLMRRSRSAP